jgi:hypothetical protein
MSMGRLVRNLRGALDLPETFTLDACWHGGMTELEEAELTDGQGRALSAHRSKAYEGYAKRTEKRALAATRKRHAHRLAIESEGAASDEALHSEMAAKSLTNQSGKTSRFFVCFADRCVTAPPRGPLGELIYGLPGIGNQRPNQARLRRR